MSLAAPVSQAEFLMARALDLRRERPHAKVPPLLFMTDPERTPDPIGSAGRLPRGCAVVLRTFGRTALVEAAGPLRSLCRQKGLRFLVAEDETLARSVDADGLHLPERSLGRAARLRLRHPNWMITGAVHALNTARAHDACGLDAFLASPVFPTRSPSARTPLGPGGVAVIASALGTPVLALGGVTAETVGLLAGTGVAGLACVDALA